MIVEHYLYKNWAFLTPLIHWARTEAWGYSLGPWIRKKTTVDRICGKCFYWINLCHIAPHEAKQCGVDLQVGFPNRTKSECSW